VDPVPRTCTGGEASAGGIVGVETMRCLTLFIATLTATACADAEGTIQGGERLVVDPCDATDGGHRWSDLYTCFFGPTGRASCTAQGFCHGAMEQTGATVSNYVCGANKFDCWQGIQAIAIPIDNSPTHSVLYAALRKSADTTKSSAANNMPCNPLTLQLPDGGTRAGCQPYPNTGRAYTFSQDDLSRITAWIGEGARED